MFTLMIITTYEQEILLLLNNHKNKNIVTNIFK